MVRTHLWVHDMKNIVKACHNSCWWVYVRICCLDSWSWNLFMDNLLLGFMIMKFIHGFSAISHWWIPFNECTNEMMAELVNMKSIQFQNYTAVNVAVFFDGKVVMNPFCSQLTASLKAAVLLVPGDEGGTDATANVSRASTMCRTFQAHDGLSWTPVVLVLAWPACQQQRKDRNIQVESLSKRWGQCLDTVKK